MRAFPISIGAAAVIASAVATTVSPDVRTTVLDLGRRTGIVDAPVRAPEAVDLIVDLSEGSSGRALEHYTQTLDVLLTLMSDAPGSTLRVIVQGATALDAKIIEPTARVLPRGKNRRARTAQKEHFLTTTKALFIQAMEPILEQRRVLRNSPIAETISWVAMLSPPPGLPPDTAHHIVVISDALEVSSNYGDFECGKLPTPDEFVKALQRRGAFMPESLKNASLHFAFTAPRPLMRRDCPQTTLARMQRIRDLWVAAGKNAGATAVTFDTHVVTLNTSAQEES